jgi:hypothetical protein
VRAGVHEDRIGEGSGALRRAVHENVGAFVDRQPDLDDGGFRRGESRFGRLPLGGRGIARLAKVLRKVLGRVALVARTDLALREVQEHGGVLFQGVGLKESRARLLELLLVEVGDAFLEPLPGGCCRRRVLVRPGNGGRDEVARDDAGAEDSGPEPVRHDRRQ